MEHGPDVHSLAHAQAKPRADETIVRRRQIKFLAATIATMTIASAMTICIGVLAPFLSRSAGLSALEIGALSAGVYVVGSLLSPRAGDVSDRLGARRAAVAMVVVSSAGFLVLAVAPSLLLMFVGVAIGGAALSLSNPVTNRVIVTAFPPGQRGAAVGWKQAGVPLASLLAGLAVPSVAAAAGWRSAFVAVSAVSLVVGGLATSTLRHVPRNEGSPDPQRPLSGRSLRWLNELGFLMGAAAGCINTYLVLYGVDALGYDERVAGLLTALVGLSGAITRVVWAAGAERGKGPEASLRIMGPVSLVAVFVTAAASYVNVWLVWVGAVLAGVGIFIFTSLGMLALMQAVPEDSVGLATGSLSRTFFAGLLAGPLAFGLVVDLAASFTLAWMAVAVVVLAATVLTHLPTFLVPVRVWPQQPGPSALS